LPGEIEAALCKEINLILGYPVGGDIDLITECDLDSFAITQIMAFLEQEFGIEIPDERLNSQSYCSISHIAGWVEALQSTHGDLSVPSKLSDGLIFRVVELTRRANAGPALFIAPTQGGLHLRYQALLNYLPEDVQVNGLQIRVSNPDEKQTIDIKSMAGVMVDVMREVQPKGPYHLLGFCFGASLAVEMAVKLIQQQEQVEFLGLIDVLLPNVEDTQVGHSQACPAPLNWLRSKIQWHASALSILHPVEFPRYGVKIIKDRIRGWDSGLGRKSTSPAVNRLIDVTHQAFAHYNPSAYTGAVNIFKGNLGGPGQYASDQQIASRFKGPTATTMVPGFHTFTLEEPWVRILGHRISVQLKNSLSNLPATASD
jgi:hypothetical protein